MTAWRKTYDDEEIPGDVLTGKAHVEFIEVLRELGMQCFSDNEDFGRYCRTVDLLGEDCRMTRQVAKEFMESSKVQKHLPELQERLKWMNLKN